MTNVCPEYKAFWRREFSAPNKLRTLWVRRECVTISANLSIFDSLATLHQMSYIECMMLQLYCGRLHKCRNFLRKLASNCYSYCKKQIYRIDIYICILFSSPLLKFLVLNIDKLYLTRLSNRLLWSELLSESRNCLYQIASPISIHFHSSLTLEFCSQLEDWQWRPNWYRLPTN